MITVKNDKSLRLLTAFLALGILVSGWGLLALEGQHKADRAISQQQALQISKNQDTIKAIAASNAALAASNAANAKTSARAQREIELEARQIAVLEKQVIALGGKPVIIASVVRSSSKAPSSPAPTPKSQPIETEHSGRHSGGGSENQPTPSPSPSPTCSGIQVGQICLP